MQIPAEESEDEPAAGEERPDPRLSEQDTAGGSQEGSRDGSKEGAGSPPETDGDGQREGQEAEQTDRTVILPGIPAGTRTPAWELTSGQGERFAAGAGFVCRIQRDLPAAEGRHPGKALCGAHVSAEVRPGRSGLTEGM